MPHERTLAVTRHGQVERPVSTIYFRGRKRLKPTKLSYSYGKQFYNHRSAADGATPLGAGVGGWAEARDDTETTERDLSLVRQSNTSADHADRHDPGATRLCTRHYGSAGAEV